MTLYLQLPFQIKLSSCELLLYVYYFHEQLFFLPLSHKMAELHNQYIHGCQCEYQDHLVDAKVILIQGKVKMFLDLLH